MSEADLPDTTRRLFLREGLDHPNQIEMLHRNSCLAHAVSMATRHTVKRAVERNRSALHWALLDARWSALKLNQTNADRCGMLPLMHTGHQRTFV
jgi:hypothetical protein